MNTTIFYYLGIALGMGAAGVLGGLALIFLGRRLKKPVLQTPDALRNGGVGLLVLGGVITGLALMLGGANPSARAGFFVGVPLILSGITLVVVGLFEGLNTPEEEARIKGGGQ
ncbi:MAG: hypothetical protein ACKO6N_17025 [Myxococcota bacterium]